MRVRLAALLLACGILGLCLVAGADDDKREGERKKGGFKFKKGDPKKGDPKRADPKADPKPADPKPDAAKPADANADAKAAKAAKVSYKTDVAPLLNDACASCHSGLKQKAKLDVTSYDSIMKFVTPGAPDKSKLHNCLVGKGAKMMPPKNPLAEDQIAVIKNWIAGGAKKD